jgi:hypothetical protein
MDNAGPLKKSLLQFAESATRALLPLAAYVIAVTFVDFADWHMGMLRAAGLATIGWALFALRRWPPPPIPQSRVWVAIIVALGLARLAVGLREIGAFGSGPDDIGYTTDFAVLARDAGVSIYATPLDQQDDLPAEESGFDFFQGYKYGPVTPLYYSLFLHAFKYPFGLYYGNVVLLLLAASLAAALAADALGGFGAAPLAAVAAFFFVVIPRFTYYELFSQGVNDLLPTVFIMAALFLASRGNGFLCGVAAGLSLACKPLPGGLYLLLLPATVRLLPLAAGGALGLCAFVPDLLRTPKEMIANLLLFNLHRSGDSTGLAAFLPAWLRPVVTLVALLLIGLVLYSYYTGPRGGASLLSSAALLATVFLATGKIDHRNYFLWWTPLLGAALAIACHRPPAEPQTMASASSLGL